MLIRATTRRPVPAAALGLSDRPTTRGPQRDSRLRAERIGDKPLVAESPSSSPCSPVQEAACVPLSVGGQPGNFQSLAIVQQPGDGTPNDGDPANNTGQGHSDSKLSPSDGLVVTVLTLYESVGLLKADGYEDEAHGRGMVSAEAAGRRPSC